MVQTEVLEETISRVDHLTRDIEQISSKIASRSNKAAATLQPLAHTGKNLDRLRANVTAVLNAVAQLRTHTNAIESSASVIDKGISAAGPHEFNKAMLSIQSTLETLMESEYRTCDNIILRATQLLENARRQLHTEFTESLTTSLPKIAVLQHVASTEPVPEPEKASVAHIKAVADVFHHTNMNDDLWALYSKVTRQYIHTTLAGPSRQLRGASMASSFAQFVSSYKSMLQGLSRQIINSQEALTLITSTVDDECQQGQRDAAKTVLNSSEDGKTILEMLESAAAVNNASTITEFLEKGRGFLVSVYKTTDVVPKVTSEVVLCGELVKSLGQLRTVALFPEAVSLCAKDQPPRWYIGSPQPAWLSRFPIAEGTPLDIFFADCVQNMLANLLVGARAVGLKPPQQGTLMLLNLVTTDQYFEKSLDPAQSPITIGRIKRANGDAFKLFLNSWQRLSLHLMDQTITAPSKHSKLSSKDREAVKERFRQFNTEFEVLVERQKACNITDTELRERMCREITNLIRPLYKRFYDKHCNGDFTKHLDKYIKHSPAELDAVLASMK